MSSPPDRATIVADIVISIIVAGLRDWVRGEVTSVKPIRREVEAVLHDAFANVARRACDGERDLPTSGESAAAFLRDFDFPQSANESVAINIVAESADAARRVHGDLLNTF
jgi:hypothetical protein